uniref:Glycine-rich protein n=1 Tax=Chenopodium quinoa TaxID=63459 RepID=A0A803MB11_CHEQI
MAATSTSSEPTSAAEGPVLSVMTKRLRALRKKLNRISQMEDSVAQGKTLNKEQQDVLRSKPAVVAVIDELDKLRAPLTTAVEEEHSLGIAASKTTPSSSPEEHQSPEVVGPEVEDHRSSENNDDNKEGVVKDLLYLMYFGSLFDVKPQGDFTSLMLTRTHERGCCLTYDYVTDDATDLLVERDLDLISALQGLMVSRPANSALSHQNALDMCVQHAQLWLNNSDQTIDPQSNITYAGLKEKLNKIMASDYFTATPQMKGPGEVAAAAAVGNFGSFQVPMHENMVPVKVPVHIEGSAEQYQDTEENLANYEDYGTREHQVGSAEEFQKEMLLKRTQPNGPKQNKDNYRLRKSMATEMWTSGSSSTFQEENGRGQYYDNYNPRNFYNKRGGRGGGGNGGNPYYNHSADQGNHAEANMGVAS